MVSDEDEEDEEEDEIVEEPQPKRTNRAAVLRYVHAHHSNFYLGSRSNVRLRNSQPAAKARKAPAKRAVAGTAKQSTLSFAPKTARAPRAAATRAKKKTVEVVSHLNVDRHTCEYSPNLPDGT